MKDHESILKEAVCAAITVAVFAAVFLMINDMYLDPKSGATFDKDAYQRHSNLLSIVVGFAGTVMGYYFGRVPAERLARAAQRSATDSATQNGAAIRDKEALTKRVRDVRDRLQASDTSGGAGAGAVAQAIAGLNAALAGEAP